MTAEIHLPLLLGLGCRAWVAGDGLLGFGGGSQ